MCIRDSRMPFVKVATHAEALVKGSLFSGLHLLNNNSYQLVVIRLAKGQPLYKVAQLPCNLSLIHILP